MLYSPVTSLNGAKLLLNKGPPRKVTIEDMSDAVTAPTILTPHALPMFRDLDPGRGSKRKREKERLDPRKSRRPEMPVTGPGKGGRVGASATQHIVQNLVRDTTRDVDVSFRPVGDTFSAGAVLFLMANFDPVALSHGRFVIVMSEHCLLTTFCDFSSYSPGKRYSNTRTLQTRIRNGHPVSSFFILHGRKNGSTCRDNFSVCMCLYVLTWLSFL